MRLPNFAKPFWLLPGFLILITASVQADSSSGSYQITQDYISAAGGNAQSANYQISEGHLAPYSFAASSSSNFSLQGSSGGAGIDGLPEIQSVTPGNPSRFYTDQSASYQVQVMNYDGDTLQYQAKEDGVLKIGPQPSSTLSWSLSSANKGKHSYSFEVIDPQGTVIQTQSGYIFRRPVK